MILARFDLICQIHSDLEINIFGSFVSLVNDRLKKERKCPPAALLLDSTSEVAHMKVVYFILERNDGVMNEGLVHTPYDTSREEEKEKHNRLSIDSLFKLRGFQSAHIVWTSREKEKHPERIFHHFLSKGEKKEPDNFFVHLQSNRRSKHVRLGYDVRVEYPWA